MPRTWLSIPILRTGIRVGRSWSDSELRPRLPAWRKWELYHGLIKAAKARGEKMTKDEATYCVDKAVDIGGLEVVEQTIEEADGEEMNVRENAMITPAQCRAARALLEWPREWLASESGIGPGSIVDFERSARAPRSVTIGALRRALEKAGIEFIDGDGQGDRLKPPPKCK